MHGCFALTHPNRFDQDHVKTGGLTKYNGLPCFTGYSAQGGSTGTWTNVGVWLFDQFFHPGLVSQYASFAQGAARIHGQYGNAMPLINEDPSQLFDKGALSDSGHPGYSHAYRPVGVREAGFDHFPCLLLMPWGRTFHQGDRLAKQGLIPRQYSFHQFGRCSFLLSLANHLPGDLAVAVCRGIDTRFFAKCSCIVLFLGHAYGKAPYAKIAN